MNQKLQKLREVSQSWSKQPADSNGQLAVNIATEICSDMVSKGNISEDIYKTMSYSLCNCFKMFEKAALDLLESFGKVVVLELNLRSNSIIGDSQNSNREFFAKCVSNFMQVSAQVAAKFNSKATPIKDATTCVRIAKILTIVTHPRTMNMSCGALKPEQVVGLANYILDVSLNFTVSMEAGTSGQAIVSILASKSTQLPVLRFPYKHLLKKDDGADVEHGKETLLYALRRQALEVVVNETERGLLCTYSIARVLIF